MESNISTSDVYRPNIRWCYFYAQTITVYVFFILGRIVPVKFPLTEIVFDILFISVALLPFLWWMHTIRYEIDDSEIIISVRPFRWRILLEDIDEIYPAAKWFQVKAFSCWMFSRRENRIRINHRHKHPKRIVFGSVIIAPEDRKGFLQELVNKVPALERQGDKVIRVSR